MPGLFLRFSGRREVQRRRRLAQRTGRVVSVTLFVRGGSSVTYAYCYRHPQPQVTGLGGTGYPNTMGNVTLYREGESTAPVVDDKIQILGVTYQIIHVLVQNNADEADGWAVYQLVTT